MQWEKALECLPLMVLKRDTAGNACYANSLWREFTGHISDLSQWHQLVHSEDSTHWMQWGTIDQPHSSECRIRRSSDGNYIWHKGSKGWHVRVAIDIHEYKRITVELAECRAREEIYKQIVENASDPVITFDAHSGIIVAVNRAAEKEFQYLSIEIVGKSLNTLIPRGNLSEGIMKMLVASMKHAMNGKLVAVGGSEPTFVVCRDGRRVPVTLSLAEIVINSRELYVATMCITKDSITQQQELRDSKDSFLRTMSHELRTPLFGILGTLSTILEDAKSISTSSSDERLDLITNNNMNNNNSESPPYVPLHSPLRSPHSPPFLNSLVSELGVRVVPLSLNSEYELRVRSPKNGNRRRPKSNKNDDLHQMEACTRSLLSVVNNMIAYYKLDLGIIPLEMPVQFRTLLQEVCGYYEGCVNGGVIFNYEVRDTVPQTVISDATLLRHVLANLISNALRFTHKGAVAVVIDAVEPVPCQAANYGSDKILIWISIADTGIGIAPEFFSQMFQPFTQMDSSNSRKYGGAGLGLAVCKQAIDLLGGEITYNSGLGLGTVFEISLPVLLGRSDTRKESTSEREGYIESDPLTLRPSSPHHPVPSRPSSPCPSSPRCSFIPASPLSSSNMIPNDSSNTSQSPHLSSSQLLASSPSNSCLSPVCSGNHSHSPSPETSQESTENDKRAPLSRLYNKYQSGLSTILESEIELDPELMEMTTSNSYRTETGTPDPSAPIPDYCLPLSMYSSLSLPPPPPDQNRKVSASAPASPRNPLSLSSSPVATTARFLRRPSFPFVLDDPSLCFMMNSPSPVLHSPSSIFTSPSPSPRQSPVSPPTGPTMVFPLHMRVLVVDDNLVNQNVLKKMLKHMECIVSTALHGKEALDILFNGEFSKFVGYNSFDLILMDCQMPVMDGLQATKAIRDWELENLKKVKIKIISLSASGASEIEKQCYDAGSDGFISKPVTLQGLCRVLADRNITT